MKKHPVDDLFKRKLEGLERTPSVNAWLKIQERQPAKRRSLVWGWYAAAGVAAAVMGGYLVWQNQQTVSPGSIDTGQTVAITRPARPDSAITPAVNVKAPAEQIAKAEKTGNRNSKDLKQSSQFTDVTKKEVSLPEPIQNAPVVVIAEKPSVPVNAIQPQPETLDIPVAQDIKTLPDEPAVSQVSKPEAEPTRTIVVAVETGPSEADEKPRSSRFSRVFRQLKNARAGEKVDWDEVGFNPKNLVARVDDRLRNKDEKSAEKDHPKEKTKL